VARLAEKVVQAVSQPYRIQDNDVHITASVGVGMYPTHGEAVEMLMKSADLALYEAKRAGKNDYRIAAQHALAC
jgi:diguanylate cyclase (GGDEF)-like protein